MAQEAVKSKQYDTQAETNTVGFCGFEGLTFSNIFRFKHF
jgi:hypothetical protein